MQNLKKPIALGASLAILTAVVGTTGVQAATSMKICKAKTSSSIAIRTRCKSSELRISKLWQLVGARGAIGARGTAGTAGGMGTAGLAGTNGALGSDGAPGNDGTPGSPGSDGRAGTDGALGSDGAPGTRGNDGAPGTRGNDGAAGTDGTPGSPGIDGIPGRDGIGVTQESIGRPCEVTLTEKPITGVFIWLEVPVKSGIFTVACDTNKPG